MPNSLDILDGRLIRALADQPRTSVVDLARRLGVARGTVQARLDKMVSRRIITGFGPDLDLRSLGYEVTAFITLEILPGCRDEVICHLQAIPEVLEAWAITGPGDLHLRVVARTNEDLQDVLNRMLVVRGISRTTTVIALSPQIAARVLPLVEASTASV
jgi:DNA-binding Lrp family transcriptional regulator